MEFLKPLFRLFPFDRLGLVNDQDRISLGNNVNGPAGAELVQFHVNPSGIFAFGVKRLGIDDHYMDGTIRRKAVHLSQLGRIIDEETDFFPVLFSKMPLRHLERLIHAFTDGDAGDYNDKLAPAICPVQFIHGFDISIGFTHAGLHLNRQVIPIPTAFQLIRRGNLVRTLDFLQLFQYHPVVQLRDDPVVAPAGIILFLIHPDLKRAPPFVHHVRRRQVGLPRKHVCDRFCSIVLKFLMLILNPHGITSFR